MMLFTAITITGVEVNPRVKIRDVVSPKAQLGIASIVGKAMIDAIAQHLVRSVPNVVERITLKLCVKLVQNVTNPSPRKDLKGQKIS